MSKLKRKMKKNKKVYTGYVETLSLTANGLLFYIHNAGKAVTLADLLNSSNDDVDTICQGLEELEKKGYIRRIEK